MNLFLTKEALYRLSYVGIAGIERCDNRQAEIDSHNCFMERETRLELATFSLEG